MIVKVFKRKSEKVFKPSTNPVIPRPGSMLSQKILKEIMVHIMTVSSVIIRSPSVGRR